MKFKDLRLLKGYDKQESLAIDLKSAKSTICMWESGKSYPSIPTIHKIAKVLGESPTTIFESFEVPDEVVQWHKK